MGERNGNIWQLPVSTLQGRFGEWHKYPMCIFSHTCNTNLNQKTSWEVPCSKQFGYSCSNCANYRKSIDEVKEQNNCQNADRADNLSLPQKGWREKGTGQACSHGLKEDLRSRPGARTGSRRRQRMLPPPAFLFLPLLLRLFRFAESLTHMELYSKYWIGVLCGINQSSFHLYPLFCCPYLNECHQSW